MDQLPSVCEELLPAYSPALLYAVTDAPARAPPALLTWPLIVPAGCMVVGPSGVSFPPMTVTKSALLKVPLPLENWVPELWSLPMENPTL